MNTPGKDAKAGGYISGRYISVESQGNSFMTVTVVTWGWLM